MVFSRLFRCCVGRIWIVPWLGKDFDGSLLSQESQVVIMTGASRSVLFGINILFHVLVGHHKSQLAVRFFKLASSN